MPVETIIIRRTLSDGTKAEHSKPLYRCEACMEPASFGFTEGDGNKRKRRWYCRTHKPA